MRRTIVLLSTMALTLLVASGVALAVTKIGSAGARSSVVGPGESIQKAVNAAHPGDTIVVKGVHREDVVIRKDGIKLRGEDAVIEAPARAKADSPCSRLLGPEGVCVLGDENIKTLKLEGQRVSDVSVSGFTFRDFNKGKGGATAPSTSPMPATPPSRETASWATSPAGSQFSGASTPPSRRTTS